MIDILKELKRPIISEFLGNEKMLEEKTRNEYALNIKNMVGEERPANKIANILYEQLLIGDK